MSADQTAGKMAYSFQEAATAVGVSIDVIRRAVRSNDLSVRYPTSKPVILTEELDAWLQALPSEAPKR